MIKNHLFATDLQAPTKPITTGSIKDYNKLEFSNNSISFLVLSYLCFRYIENYYRSFFNAMNNVTKKEWSIL